MVVILSSEECDIDTCSRFTASRSTISLTQLHVGHAAESTAITWLFSLNNAPRHFLNEEVMGYLDVTDVSARLLAAQITEQLFVVTLHTLILLLFSLWVNLAASLLCILLVVDKVDATIQSKPLVELSKRALAKLKVGHWVSVWVKGGVQVL